MSEYRTHNWECNKCHRILGVVVRGPDRRTKLAVLRNGCHPDNADTLADLRTIHPIVVLEAGEVTCGWCGNTQAWSISEQAIDDLLARRKKRTFGLEVER